MELFMDLLQVRIRYVGIDLSCLNRRMTEQLLDGTNICTVIEKVGRK